MFKTLQEEITHAAKAVEASIQNGQPLEMVDTKPVIDLLDEVGTGKWQLVDSPGGNLCNYLRHFIAVYRTSFGTLVLDDMLMLSFDSV